MEGGTFNNFGLFVSVPQFFVFLMMEYLPTSQKRSTVMQHSGTIMMSTVEISLISHKGN